MHELKLSDIPEKTRIHKFSNYFNTLKKNFCPLIPEWSSFNPMEVAEILPWIVVIERKNESLSGHKFRLIGESVIQLMGDNYTGRNLREVLTSEGSSAHWQDLKAVAECREPSFFKTVIPVKNREHNKVYRGAFPFCDEHKEIIRLVIVLEIL